MQKEPFNISVPDKILQDLRERLTRTILPIDFSNSDWTYGVNRSYVDELVDYWLNQYDWRKCEQEMNAFAHYKTTIDNVPIHFIHESGKGPNAIPLILTHGWPWTFWDFHKMIRPLTDPASFGGDPRDSFDVVVPSLPGFGFSSPLTVPGINFSNTADLWVSLMKDLLGYQKFGAHGGDWGALVTMQLGHKYAKHLLGIHLSLASPLGVMAGEQPKPEDYSPEEADWPDRMAVAMKDTVSHVTVQATDPQTLAYAMHDSPVGLCAWILERRRNFSDCEGDVERRFSKDDLLTTAMVYWVTKTFVTSARYYYEARHNLWQPSHSRSPVVEAPTGVAVFPRDVKLMPKRWAERYYNLKRWTVMPSGGHFAAMEEPEQLVKEIRAFFRPMR